ncbi:hypothetical protein DBR40_25800 [Pedobacter sp. KBW01]|uniref:HTH domain-containing protein n=1 Tax=Pedobacter sp. KBW01 TaxID=2153364 RepID=UPI000F5B3221|nr:HTH domain-containing protein [Pedobacter sp. KBW01]RQO64355.1 hypothetical protein DBR40_25800 [Pedobacter sp. KBW01]
MSTPLKQGEILERLIRKDRMGISELSRKLKVSRRTIYNWFSQERINQEIIWQVGSLLGQDLSTAFPDFFPVSPFDRIKDQTTEIAKSDQADSNTVYFWMNKYILLLEKYNGLLGKEFEPSAIGKRKRFSLTSEREEVSLY